MANPAISPNEQALVANIIKSNSKMSLDDRVLLANTNVSMPRLGFGVYKIKGGRCTQACVDALAAGYRHIDSAQLYRNETQVGDAVRESKLARKDIFLTTKIGIAKGDDEKTYRSALSSVEKLAGEHGYVDLFLIHVPGSRKEHRKELWRALERLYAKGRAKSIGVSNFRVQHIKELQEYATVWPPHVNQIELHPWCQQRELVEYCKANRITIQAYSPLATGANLDNAKLKIIAGRHGKSPAQVLIRYSLQKGWVPLPKSENYHRIVENTKVFDFEIDTDDMKTLDELDQGSAGARFPANVD
ncbi:Fc.00g109820.m01.CDS01 [Cosmosporella sp. VM-42]